MFVLSRVEDVIRLEPSSFDRPTIDSLEDEINRKYANKVIHDVGLCICVYDVESHGEGLIKPGDGAVYVKTVFRLVVFRPFVGEILVGWVSSCTEDGLNVKMEFFDDIFIPKNMLFEGCVFVPKEQAWVWKVGDTSLYIDTNEKIRFRVEREYFTQQIPKRPNEAEDEAVQRVAPYSIEGSCQVDGMGLVSWWDE